MTDKTKVLDRIRECLALAGSSEPHEAASAQGMMAGREVDLHSGVGLDRPTMLTGGYP